MSRSSSVCDVSEEWSRRRVCQNGRRVFFVEECNVFATVTFLGPLYVSSTLTSGIFDRVVSREKLAMNSIPTGDPYRRRFLRLRASVAKRKMTNIDFTRGTNYYHF